MMTRILLALSILHFPFSILPAADIDFGAVASVRVGTNEVQAIAVGGQTVWRNYAEVEYIESTGREWIDTGVQPGTGTGNVLTIKAAYVGGNTVGCLFGVVTPNPARFFQLNKTSTGEQFRLITSSGDKFYTKSSSFYSAAHTYEVRANVLYIDGTSTVTGSGNHTFGANLFLFARNDLVNGMAVGAQKGKWRVYSVKMTRNGTTLLDAVPYRVGTEYGLYDRVSGAFLRNVSGSGAFLGGPDKTP